MKEVDSVTQVKTRLLKLAALAAVVLMLAGMAPGRVSAAKAGTYASPSFGFTISWDPAVWDGTPADQAEGVSLSSDASYALIQAVSYDGSLADCVSDSVTSVAGGDDVTN